MTLTGYNVINLNDMLTELNTAEMKGEDRVKSILSSFSCPLNQDVEMFLRTKAIEFAKQGLSRTYLVFTSFRGSPALIAYFTIAIKVIQVKKSSLSSNLRKRISKFATYNQDIACYTLPAPLIAQLSKNFSNGLNNQIAGDELLALAMEKVEEIHLLGGGRTVYLECEDKDCLVDFYTSNGFVSFGIRTLATDEKSGLSGDGLVQMLRYCQASS